MRQAGLKQLLLSRRTETACGQPPGKSPLRKAPVKLWYLNSYATKPRLGGVMGEEKQKTALRPTATKQFILMPRFLCIHVSAPPEARKEPVPSSHKLCRAGGATPALFPKGVQEPGCVFPQVPKTHRGELQRSLFRAGSLSLRRDEEDEKGRKAKRAMPRPDTDEERGGQMTEEAGNQRCRLPCASQNPSTWG